MLKWKRKIYNPIQSIEYSSFPLISSSKWSDSKDLKKKKIIKNK